MPTPYPDALGTRLPLLEQSTDRNTVVPFGALWIGRLGEGYLLAGRWMMRRGSPGRRLTLARSARSAAMRRRPSASSARSPRIAIRPDAGDGRSPLPRQALALADELGMRPLVAHCHLGLGTLYRRTGDRAKAEEHLTTATTMYREMGMTFWLEKADAELRGVER